MSAPAVLADELVEAELCERARQNPATFNDYVLRDEKTGAPIESAKLHREWHRLASRHTRLIIQSGIELGKTQQLSVGRVLWELGRNPNLSVLIVANVAGQAAKIGQLLGRYIESSEELHRVFPELRRDPAGVWNQTALSVKRSAPSKDPSIQVCGVHGNVLGARVDRLVVDDILDFENARTTAARDDLSRWFDSTLLGRLTADARVLVVGNPWHRDDLLARLTQRPGWKSEKYAVENLLGRSRWPERWPASRIASVRRDLGPREAARQLDCVPPDDADPVVHHGLIARALELGKDAVTEVYASVAQRGDPIILSCDIATGLERRHDESALVLTRYLRATGKKEVTWAKAGRFPLDDLVDNIVDAAQLNRAVVAVETNGPGAVILELLKKRGVPVVGLATTAANKRMRVEMLISELTREQWSFRQPGFLSDDMRKLAEQAASFAYDEHCGDLMAAWLIGVQALRERENRRPVRFFQMDLMRR